MKCAVLGDPIAHSLSPILHKAGYSALGLDWTYKARRVAADGLAEFIAGCGPEWRGLSLTMPLKREAIALADTVTERARLAGAANTLVLDDGALHGDNTDIPGAAAAIRERYDGPVLSATILGGGATAASAGTRPVRPRSDRHPAPGQVTGAGGGDRDRDPSAPVGPVVIGRLPRRRLRRGRGVVSTIPGRRADVATWSAVREVEVTSRCSTTRGPRRSPARFRRPDLVGGLDLLVHQAALQFSLFTGHEAPLEEMRAAGEAELAARTV
jgi:shikimate dehydrogenase